MIWYKELLSTALTISDSTTIKVLPIYTWVRYVQQCFKKRVFLKYILKGIF